MLNLILYERFDGEGRKFEFLVCFVDKTDCVILAVANITTKL